jgi:hypothetical protein
MKTNNRDLKLAYKSIIQNRRGESRKNCPSAEEMWTLLGKRRSRRQKAGLIDHITDCSACHEEFQAFLEMGRAEKRLIENVRETYRSPVKSTRFSWNWRLASALLALVVVVGLALFATSWLGVWKHSDERGRHSGQLRLLAPATRRAIRAPLRFEWETVPNAQHYIIEVFDSSLRPVWKSPPVTQNSCEIPAPAELTLPRKANYFWMLTAFLQDGTKAESSLEQFELIN